MARSSSGPSPYLRACSPPANTCQAENTHCLPTKESGVNHLVGMFLERERRLWGRSVEVLQSSLHSIETKHTKPRQSIGLFCEASLDREDKVPGDGVRDKRSGGRLAHWGAVSPAL